MPSLKMKSSCQSLLALWMTVAAPAPAAEIFDDFTGETDLFREGRAPLGWQPDCIGCCPPALSYGGRVCLSSAGNAAGTGARIALLSAKARGEIERVARLVEKEETAIAEKFQDYFVAAMSIPHSSEPYPLLNAWLEKEGLLRKE